MKARRSWSAWVILALLVSAVGGWIVIDRYGGASYLPGLFGGFAASLLAFLLALTWERERESQRARSAATALEQQRITEARRRLEPVRSELEKNAKSLKGLAESLAKFDSGAGFQWFNPQLLEGAWNASASRLSELIADYKLIADLATAYGRLEELRWRLRLRTEKATASYDEGIIPLVDELRDELDGLLELVRNEIAAPSVQPLGLLHRVSGSAVVRATATMEREVIRGDTSDG